MRKKIALASSILLLSTLANAEIAQSGFFVGLDISQMDSKLKYDNTGTLGVRRYTNDMSDMSYSIKAGYQAYFTRVYARYNSFEYKDESRNKFKIESGKTYELNADYIPVFYMSESQDWNIRGIFGVGIGYNTSKMSDYDTNLLPVGERAGANQNYMEYGYQIGVLSETSLGLSFEAAYRARYGNIQEFSDGANNATFSLETKEFYIGLNYLF